ncbi:MAG: hypothetical protein EOO17_00455 [Chloroflexi bacterium]|nr:MAG: hypothetical protein EOO17_00455 [Chloroflexota bacterium]
MNNRQTVILGISTVVVLAVVVIVGVVVSSPQQPTPAPAPQQQTDSRPLSEQELDALLQTELPTLAEVLTTKFPAAVDLYTINQGKLYDRGQWYGTTLTYRGSDEDNRDTLRVLMQKKDGVWIVRTTPPQLLLSQKSYPDVPKTILQTINQPAELPGTTSSPAIN